MQLLPGELTAPQEWKRVCREGIKCNTCNGNKGLLEDKGKNMLMKEEHMECQAMTIKQCVLTRCRRERKELLAEEDV